MGLPSLLFASLFSGFLSWALFVRFPVLFGRFPIWVFGVLLFKFVFVFVFGFGVFGELFRAFRLFLFRVFLLTDRGEGWGD